MTEGWERKRTLGHKVVDTELVVDISEHPTAINEIDINMIFIPTDGIAAAIWMEKMEWRPNEWSE